MRALPCVRSNVSLKKTWSVKNLATVVAGQHGLALPELICHTYLLSKKPAYLGGFFGCWGSIWDTEKGIGEGEGEGGRECELKREGETETG